MTDIIDLTQAKRLIAQYSGELAKLRAELDKERQRRFDGNQIASEEARNESREQQSEIERLRAELDEQRSGLRAALSGNNPEKWIWLGNRELMRVLTECESMRAELDALRGQEPSVVNAAYAAMHSPAAQPAIPDGQVLLEQIADVFGIGVEARNPAVVLENVRNAARRSACLSMIEAHHTITVEDEDGEPVGEQLLRWGENPAQYIETYKKIVAKPTIPDGFVIVPKEPTSQQESIIRSLPEYLGPKDARQCYLNLLAAAPKPGDKNDR